MALFLVLTLEGHLIPTIDRIACLISQGWRFRSDFFTAVLVSDQRKTHSTYANLQKPYNFPIEPPLRLVISIAFARLSLFFIPLPFCFVSTLPHLPAKSQFQIFHTCVKMYVYLEMWALIHLLWLVVSSDGGQCPNDKPKNCNCTLFGKGSSFTRYKVDCMGYEHVPSGIPSNTVILYVLYVVIYLNNCQYYLLKSGLGDFLGS